MSSLQPTTAPRSRAWVPIALAAILALLVGLGVGWWLGGRDSGTQGGASTTSPPTCPTPEPLPAPASVTVNVLNGSGKSGLARKTATEVEARGFVIGEVANADQPITGVAEVRHGAAGERSAVLVAANVAGTATLVADDRTGAGVDLVLGPQYAGLAAPAEVAQKTAAAEAAPATC
jgi:hypothetical protein